MSQHIRTSNYIAPSPNPSSIPRKRNLSASAIPLRPPPNLRTNTSTPSTPQPVKEEEISDNENDGKDDYGDLGVTGENREEENKEERERLKYLAHKNLHHLKNSMSPVPDCLVLMSYCYDALVTIASAELFVHGCW